ncbi:hypothetical protein D030_5278A, partial [Vibrio parahaemolyticus AQ3810]
MKTFDIFS